MQTNTARDTAAPFPTFQVGEAVILANPSSFHANKRGMRGTVTRSIKCRRSYDVKLEDGSRYEAFQESLQHDYQGYVMGLPLVQALWWFIEERDGLDSTQANNIFFALRERYRQTQQSD